MNLKSSSGVQQFVLGGKRGVHLYICIERHCFRYLGVGGGFNKRGQENKDQIFSVLEY